ncbi:hypothetical protein HanXRQr2_Chr14g0632111 [Helianthus annuus]|uniref:Uncharacterized protein n=2 Tax=Helianthus annuus TaxID=4232 RepID=A0A9K3H5B2_HELAN|nr:hypothetical protein HanXRQr2_Chr14g0632111 [Helianthus annuus]KAJ0467503.1 hypothetical protein HanIR_Chr14g0685981 [Helianthus annuus]KAJ0839393.1 hypothetical protein HanPSC8_Chr14g0606271 [Helianthus annuus]
MDIVIGCINTMIGLICGGRAAIHPLGVRVEDVMRRDEPQIRTRTKIALVTALIIFIVLMLGFISYLYIATHNLETEQPLLKSIDTQNVSVSGYKNDTVPLEVKLGLRVSFNVPDNLKAYPKLGTFVLSTFENRYYTRRAFTNSPYKISQDDQLILLNFQLGDLQMKLYDELMWIKVSGDFKMIVKIAKFPLFPQAYRDACFVCNVGIKIVQLDKIYLKDCSIVTSQVPY